MSITFMHLHMWSRLCLDESLCFAAFLHVSAEVALSLHASSRHIFKGWLIVAWLLCSISSLKLWGCF